MSMDGAFRFLWGKNWRMYRRLRGSMERFGRSDRDPCFRVWRSHDKPKKNEKNQSTERDQRRAVAVNKPRNPLDPKASPRHSSMGGHLLEREESLQFCRFEGVEQGIRWVVFRMEELLDRQHARFRIGLRKSQDLRSSLESSSNVEILELLE
jgi:hypothetical protein